MQNRDFNASRFFAILLFTCIILTFFFSVCYIISNVDHYCIQEYCTICERLQICTNIINKFSISLYMFLLIIFTYLILLVYTILLVNPDKKENTPVKLKVRLDN